MRSRPHRWMLRAAFFFTLLIGVGIVPAALDALISRPVVRGSHQKVVYVGEEAQRFVESRRHASEKFRSQWDGETPSAQARAVARATSPALRVVSIKRMRQRTEPKGFVAGLVSSLVEPKVVFARDTCEELFPASYSRESSPRELPGVQAVRVKLLDECESIEEVNYYDDLYQIEDDGENDAMEFWIAAEIDSDNPEHDMFGGGTMGFTAEIELVGDEHKPTNVLPSGTPGWDPQPPCRVSNDIYMNSGHYCDEGNVIAEHIAYEAWGHGTAAGAILGLSVALLECGPISRGSLAVFIGCIGVTVVQSAATEGLASFTWLLIQYYLDCVMDILNVPSPLSDTPLIMSSTFGVNTVPLTLASRPEFVDPRA